MHDQQLDTANINNLTSLWQQMGAVPCDYSGMQTFKMSLSWPARCWYQQTPALEELPVITQGIMQSVAAHIIPVWHSSADFAEQFTSLLSISGFTLLFQQTAMYLDLNNPPPDNDNIEQLALKPVISAQDIQTWTSIAMRAFAYPIDESVIQRINTDPDVQLFMACVNRRPVATVMLYVTDDIIGIHQMGVLPEYRRRGIARQVMQHVIRYCARMPVRFMTLQASASGKPLYQSLNFQEQFRIDNYQRSNAITIRPALQ